MMRTIQIYGTLLWAGLTIGTATAQEGAWRHFRTLEEVNEVAEGASNVWLATKHGAVNIDKATHQHEWYLPYNSTLMYEHVSSVAVEPATGHVWLGMHDMALMRWDGSTFVEEALPTDIVALLEPLEAKFLKIAFAPNGDLWVGTSMGALHRSGGVWTLFDEDALNNPEIVFGAVWDISFDNLGNTFFASHDLVRRDAQGVFHDVNISTFDFFSYNDAHVESRGNRTYFMSDMGGVCIYEGDATLLASNIIELTGLQTCNPTTNSLVDAPGDDVLVKMPDSDLMYKFVDLALETLTEEVIGLASNRPDQVWSTADGTRWAVKGDYIWWKEGMSAPENDRLSNQILNTQIYGIEQAADGRIYVLNNVSYVDPPVFSIYDYTTGEWTYQQGPLGANNLQKDDQGRLWVGALAKMYRLDGNVWTDVSAGINMPSTIASVYSNSVYGDHIWIADNYKLYHYNGTDWTTFTSANSDLFYQGYISKVVARADGGCFVQQFNTVSQAYHLHAIDAAGNFTTINLLTELGMYYLTDMVQAADGTLWGSDFGKLYHFDGSNWTVYGPEQGVDVYYPYDLAFMPDGRLVAGLAEDGLAIFDNGVTTYMSPENSELASGNIIKVATDNIGTIWVALENIGIDAYNANNFEPNKTEKLTVVPGLLSAQPNPTEGATTLRWTQAQAATNVAITVFDVHGRRLQQVAVGATVAGNHTLPIDLGNRPAGMYVAQIVLDGQVSNTVIVKK
jgi:hypothetical protein